MARAFGYRFFDQAGAELPEGGAALARLSRIDGQTDPRLIRASIDVACDVRNPLLGPEGASAIFGPQKGATPDMVRELDAALTRYADVVERHVGRPIRDVPGAGAAGGLGAGLLAFLDARLVSGALLVLDAVGFEHSLGGASLVITGEGRIDGQSIYGKLTHAVTVAARHRGVPVVAIAGMTGEGVQAMRDAGIESIETLAASADERPAAMRDPLPRIERAAARLVQTRGEPPSV
jgi:glycerate kinase